MGAVQCYVIDALKLCILLCAVSWTNSILCNMQPVTRQYSLYFESVVFSVCLFFISCTFSVLEGASIVSHLCVCVALNT